VLAIVSAMHEEIAAIVASLSRVATRELGGRQFHRGSFHGIETVVVYSRLGKVAAATTVTQLLASFEVSELVFSGVAGAVGSGLAIGDIVVASGLIQHDMDASPLFPRYQVPLTGTAVFEPDAQLSARLATAARQFVIHDLKQHIVAAELALFGISEPRVVGGLIASGDKFFASGAEVSELRARLPDLACVEMEGAAVAQVCADYQVPYAVVRTLSDSADEGSARDFPRFTREIARQYSRGILRRFLADA
jgi:adenosylhomocysteine nucleosidase